MLVEESKGHITASIPPYKEQLGEEGGVQTYLGLYFSIKSFTRRAKDILLQVSAPYNEQFGEDGGVQTYLGLYFSIKSLVMRAKGISLQVFHHIKSSLESRRNVWVQTHAVGLYFSMKSWVRKAKDMVSLQVSKASCRLGKEQFGEEGQECKHILDFISIKSLLRRAKNISL